MGSTRSREGAVAGGPHSGTGPGLDPLPARAGRGRDTLRTPALGRDRKGRRKTGPGKRGGEGARTIPSGNYVARLVRATRLASFDDCGLNLLLMVGPPTGTSSSWGGGGNRPPGYMNDRGPGAQGAGRGRVNGGFVSTMARDGKNPRGIAWQRGRIGARQVGGRDVFPRSPR